MQATERVHTADSYTDRKTRQTLMAIGAHADDIELCVGGTLAKYHDHGYEVVYVMSTNNMSGDWHRKRGDGTIEVRRPPVDEMMPERKKEAAAGAAFFGTKPIHLDYPQRHYTRADGSRVTVGFGNERPDGVPEQSHTILTAPDDDAAVQRVADLILEHQPEAVLTHGGQMVNVEHFATLVLVSKGYWRAVDAGYEGMLLSWHDLGVHLFGEAYKRWDTFVDITDYWDRKMACSALHASQKPEPERLDWPQWGPACGCGHAEVFTIIGRLTKPKQAGAFGLEIQQHA